MKKQQLSGPEPATSRSIADSLTAARAKVTASIHWSIPLLSTSYIVWACSIILYPEPPLTFPHQLMINTRLLLRHLPMPTTLTTSCLQCMPMPTKCTYLHSQCIPMPTMHTNCVPRLSIHTHVYLMASLCDTPTVQDYTLDRWQYFCPHACTAHTASGTNHTPHIIWQTNSNSAS